MNGYYFVMTRRYICYPCKAKHDQKVASGQLLAKVWDEETQYTFTATNPKTVLLEPYGRGMNLEVPTLTLTLTLEPNQNPNPNPNPNPYPNSNPNPNPNLNPNPNQAVLTETSGVDESVVNLMRPLFAAGVKPSRMARAMLELHSKTHTREHIKYEHELTRCRHELGIGQRLPRQPVMFSSFTNKGLYAGAVPSGSYLGSIFKCYGALIKDHLAAEVKKRGAEHLNWDVSYKTPKHLCRYHGHSIFKGLVTATNNFGEIR
jgi:hypothetical protein